MCPDKQFLSIYYDGELPDVWEKKLETHIEACHECSERINIYKNTSVALNGDTVVDDERYTTAMDAARERIWQKLDGENFDHKFIQPRFALNIPTAFTAVAAGAAVAVAVILITLFVSPKQNDQGGFAAASAPDNGLMNVAISHDYELNIPEIAPTADMQELLRYLENDDSSNIIIIKLPERKKFNQYGEPAIINAAEHPRLRPQ
jgi:hypothetical protein